MLAFARWFDCLFMAHGTLSCDKLSQQALTGSGYDLGHRHGCRPASAGSHFAGGFHLFFLAFCGLPCFTRCVRAEVSKHQGMIRLSLLQSERLSSKNPTTIREGQEIVIDKRSGTKTFLTPRGTASTQKLSGSNLLSPHLRLL